jgi:hypothetical protein
VIDVNLRLLDGAAFTNCRSMALLGDFLVLLVTVTEGQSGIVALNAKHLVSRSHKANADAPSTGASVYLKRGEKTQSKVAAAFVVQTVR